MFTNDIMVFLCVNVHKAFVLCKIIEVYEKWSRQKVNMSKSSMLFLRNIKKKTRSGLLEFMGLTQLREDIKLP